MLGCSKRSLYFLDCEGILKDFEAGLNDALPKFMRVGSCCVEYKQLKRVPVWCKYVRVRTKFPVRNEADLEYNREGLGELKDPDFCLAIAKSIVGRRVEEREKKFWFSCLSGRKWGRDYLIIVWR